jgi:hypothetical protein
MKRVCVCLGNAWKQSRVTQRVDIIQSTIYYIPGRNTAAPTHSRSRAAVKKKNNRINLRAEKWKLLARRERAHCLARRLIDLRIINPDHCSGTIKLLCIAAWL